MLEKKQIIKLDGLFLNCFLIALFLFAVPNFYLLPYLKSPFLTTQGIARIIICIIFLYKIIVGYYCKDNIIKYGNRSLIFLVVLFFFIQSASIFSAINITSFLSSYKDIALSIAVFFITLSYKKYINNIFYVLLGASLLNILFQFLVFFDKTLFLDTLGNITYQRYLNLLIADLGRGRIYVTTYDEIVIPYLFLLIFKSNLKKQFMYYIWILSIVFFSIASNFRTRFLMSIFPLMGVFLIFKDKLRIRVVFILLAVLILGYSADKLLLSTIGYSLYDRFIINNETSNETNSITSRIDQFQVALDMGENLLGVGLGNYYDNVNSAKKTAFTLQTNQTLTQEFNQGVHNNFAMVLSESGYISFFIYTIIIILFLKNDILLLIKGEKHQKALVLSFWTLFLYGLFNPPIPVSYQVLFWGLRGLLA